MAELYQHDCMSDNSVFYGVGAQVAGNGTVLDVGRVDKTLVVELKGWASTVLTTMVFSILAQELFGYEVSFFRTTDLYDMTQRMSSVGKGRCSPVHVNLEVSATAIVKTPYMTYANETYNAGSVGYVGSSGLYTTAAFIQEGLEDSATNKSKTYAADFWRDYKDNEQLLHLLRVSTLKDNSKYYPPAENACKDGSLGCLNACSKTVACTRREAQGKECMVVAMMYDYYDKAYVQAVFTNLDIPSYFCFLGYKAMESYAIESAKNGTPVVFYHYEPDPLHAKYADVFERIALPRSTAERAMVATEKFGEYGYGNKTDNPVRVDFPLTSYSKYAATIVQDHEPLRSLVSRIALTELQINQLMAIHVRETEATTSSLHPDHDFAAACAWVKDNYPVWSLWLGRLPLCDFFKHLTHTVIGCGSSASTETEATSDVFPRQVLFEWIMPNPRNSSLPHNCDGGMNTLPAPLITSRTCEWLDENLLIWAFWIFAKPRCDATFYTYNVSHCDHTGSTREVQYHWLLPDAMNVSQSAECTGGIALPAPVMLACGYVPYTNAGFHAVAVFASLLSFVLVLAMVFVYHFRNVPIIKRSQYEFLEVMLFGGIVVNCAVCGYAGQPTTFLCKFRPVGLALGFTLIFGALVVKSLRVYRVFLSGAMKRVVLSTRTMFKILTGFLCVDLLILVAWEVVDPSLPRSRMEKTPEIGGHEVPRLLCSTGSFIFTAILLFWKAGLLFVGLYLSFLIRKVSSDFQESVYIFASTCIVLFTSLVLLPMGYLVTLPATMFYLFFAILLLMSTATVMALMIVPKILRLSELGMDSKVSSDTTARKSSNTASAGSNSVRKASSSDQASTPGPKAKVRVNIRGSFPGLSARVNSRRKPSRVQATPVQPFVTEKRKPSRVQSTPIQPIVIRDS